MSIQDIITDVLGQEGNGRTTRNNGEQVIPTTTDTTAMSFNEFSQRNGHFFFDGTGVVDVTRDTEKLGTSVVLSTERVEPITTSIIRFIILHVKKKYSPSHDSGADSDSFDVSNGSGATIKTNIGREWRLKSGLTFISFERFNQSL